MGRSSGACANASGYVQSRVDGRPAIDCSVTVLEQIRAEVVDGLRSVPRGGLEVGGLLFGTEREGSVRIVSRRPLGCEHASGPGFVLSEKDEAGLRDLLAASQADPGLAGLRPVGWYRSRTRSGISLSEDDNVLHSRHFTEPGQVVLVLRPEHGGLARAEFFARASDGTMTGGHEFALAPPTRRRTPGMVPRTAPRPEKRPEPELPRFLRVAEAKVSRRRLPSLSWRWLAVMLTLVFVGIGVAGRSYEQPEPPAPKTPDIQLRAVDVNGQLVITWDRQAVPVVKSRKAVLSISDGINKSALDLDRDAVTKGSVTYARRSGRVDVRLRVSCEREHVEEVALFLGAPVPREGDDSGELRTATAEPQPKLPFTAETRRRGEN